MKLSTIASQSFHNDVSKKLVFVSKSTNIFENLAIEDWLYKNFDFETQSLLFMWVNTPWLVINLLYKYL
jgi:lipoyltransferase 1